MSDTRKVPLGAVISAPYSNSPEEIAENWRCPSCDNTKVFIGVDDHGYGGEIDEHDDGCPTATADEFGNGPDGKPVACSCDCVLAQYVYVEGYEVVDYSSHEGGGCGAEIGSYTRVYCAECSALLWKEADVEETLPPPL